MIPSFFLLASLIYNFSQRILNQPYSWLIWAGDRVTTAFNQENNFVLCSEKNESGPGDLYF